MALIPFLKLLFHPLGSWCQWSVTSGVGSSLIKVTVIQRFLRVGRMEAKCSAPSKKDTAERFGSFIYQADPMYMLTTEIRVSNSSDRIHYHNTIESNEKVIEKSEKWSDQSVFNWGDICPRANGIPVPPTPCSSFGGGCRFF
ncbi:hypothetical protein CEXT_622291 [Caerostris extrusa]|uniref:Uncharacterized protein n=1 Tax=Caerostris extrusa TaxID=172846 RepID=A0AAV4MVX5_CAEEX|nr:hypothetical protein CEXT_622291 [Caerostris extrusa]